MLIFRLLSWGGFLTALIFFFLKQEKFVSLDKETFDAEKLLKDAALGFEIDKNKSSDLINGLFRERGKLRLQTEEALSNAETLKEEAELIMLREPSLVSKRKELLAELNSIKNELNDQQLRIQEAQAKRDPISLKKENLSEEIKKLEDENKEVRKSRDTLNADLSALKVRRNIAKESYISEKDELLSYIERPPYHYYGDELEINVLSISPSGSGVFVENGLNSGFRDDFEYLAYEQSQPNRLFYLKASLVQKELTFLAFEQGFRQEATSFIQADQKLFLIRSGDSNTTLY